jgi:hypothetical protein
LRYKFSISAKKTTRFLLYTVAILVALSSLSQAAVYFLPDFILRDLIARKLTVSGEQNFPALYSSIALFFCSVLFFIIFKFKSRLKDKYTLSWKALSFIFVYLSLDELLSFHENLTTPFRQLGFGGILNYAWVVPGIVAVGIFCLVFYRFFQHLPQYMKRLMLFAFFVFLGGAIVTEIIGGYYEYLYGRENLGYFLIATIEESMEMLGIVILIHALLTYIKQLGIDAFKIDFHMNDQTLRELKQNSK